MGSVFTRHFTLTIVRSTLTLKSVHCTVYGTNVYMCNVNLPIFLYTLRCSVYGVPVHCTPSSVHQSAGIILYPVKRQEEPTAGPLVVGEDGFTAVHVTAGQ